MKYLYFVYYKIYSDGRCVGDGNAEACLSSALVSMTQIKSIENWLKDGLPKEAENPTVTLVNYILLRAEE